LLDWRLHDDVGVSILLGIVGALGVLYYPEIYERLRAQFRLEQYGDEVKTLLITSPVALFFMLRGRGVSVPGFGLDLGAGLLVAIVLVGGAVALRHVMPSIDVSLQGFYRTRDQYLPPPACIGVMVLLSVLFTFGLVHGELGDVAVILGQDSDKLDGPSLGNMLIIVLANMALAVAFLRRAPQ